MIVPMTTEYTVVPRSFSLSMHAGRGDRLDRYRDELREMAKGLNALLDEPEWGFLAFGAANETETILTKLSEADAYASKLCAVWRAAEAYTAAGADEDPDPERLRAALQAHAGMGVAPVAGFDGAAYTLSAGTVRGGVFGRGVIARCARCSRDVGFWCEEVLTLEGLNEAMHDHHVQWHGPELAHAKREADQLAAARRVLVERGLLAEGDEDTDLGEVLRAAVPAAAVDAG